MLLLYSIYCAARFGSKRNVIREITIYNESSSLLCTLYQMQVVMVFNIRRTGSIFHSTKCVCVCVCVCVCTYVCVCVYIYIYIYIYIYCKNIFNLHLPDKCILLVVKNTELQKLRTHNKLSLTVSN